MHEVSRPEENWLRQNHSLRMDANSELFPADRRQFHIDRYEFARNYCCGKRVLDGACGTGYGSSLLGAAAAQVMGIDCAPDAVAYAAKTYGTPSVQFRRSFVELTPFESSSFDVVVSFETVEHTLCPRAHMMEIARLLEPLGGKAILSVPNGWGYTDHHFFDFDLTLLKKITTEFFEQAEFYYQNPKSSATRPGIGLLVPDVFSDDQCIVAVCSGPRKDKVVGERLEVLMDEIYKNAFARHNEYRALAYRQNTSFLRRAVNRFRSMVGG